MARHAEPKQQPADMPDILPARAAGIEAAQDALSLHADQASKAMKVIGYELPYDRERVVQETRFYMAQSAEAMLEAGRRLLVLKENEPYGEFEDIVRERLGMPERTAQVVMQAAAKYLLNPKLEAKAQTFALLGKSKLFELMTQPDDDLAFLADGGTLVGKTLDEIDAMSVRELKAALLESRAERKASQELLDKKNQKIDQLERAQKRIAKLPPDQALADLKKEASSITADAEGAILGGLRQALVAINNHGDERGMHNVYMAGLVGQVQVQLNALRQEFNLPDVSTAADQKLAAEMAEWDKE